MSKLLELSPFDERKDDAFLEEMVALTIHHLKGNPEYAKIWPNWRAGKGTNDLPFLHSGIFKHIEFRTFGEGIRHERILKSSATTSGTSSQIALDSLSSRFQTRSTLAILRDFLGEAPRPLLILDSSLSLRTQGTVSARIAAAMSLRPLATEFFFLLDAIEDPGSLNYDRLLCALRKSDELLVYGFTWMLWLAWKPALMPASIRKALAGKKIHFVHSGGWKKLEAMKVSHEDLNLSLLENLHPSSRVLDFYGLVEQAGIIYPLCEAGSRHAPIWSDVLVRDPLSLKVVSAGESGVLQLMNTLAFGAPYHSVLTEDFGTILNDPCPCGRSGRRFKLNGRIPKAEIRGCANV